VVLPFINDAGLDGAVEKFTKAAKKVGADRAGSIGRDDSVVDFHALFVPAHSEIHEQGGLCAHAVADVVYCAVIVSIQA